jgi:hypothetical protein
LTSRAAALTLSRRDTASNARSCRNEGSSREIKRRPPFVFAFARDRKH